MAHAAAAAARLQAFVQVLRRREQLHRLLVLACAGSECNMDRVISSLHDKKIAQKSQAFIGIPFSDKAFIALW